MTSKEIDNIIVEFRKAIKGVKNKAFASNGEELDLELGDYEFINGIEAVLDTLENIDWLDITVDALKEIEDSY